MSERARPLGAGVSRGLAVLVGVAAGCLVGMQAPINARLGKAVGSVQAATFSFLVGTVALVLISTFVNGGLGQLSNVGRAPSWALVGGLLGAVYVTVALIAVRTLGASGLTAVVITGQLAISVAIDRFGLFGIARQQIDVSRIVGLALLVAGVVLVVRK
jgi:bacterial/archaeal transporter family-2 protein